MNLVKYEVAERFHNQYSYSIPLAFGNCHSANRKPIKSVYKESNKPKVPMVKVI